MASCVFSLLYDRPNQIYRCLSIPSYIILCISSKPNSGLYFPLWLHVVYDVMTCSHLKNYSFSILYRAFMLVTDPTGPQNIKIKYLFDHDIVIYILILLVGYQVIRAYYYRCNRPNHTPCPVYTRG